MKTSILVWTVLLLGAATVAHAQRFDWVRHGVSLHEANAWSVISDGQGNLYVGGYFSTRLEMADFQITGSGPSHAFIGKFSEDGKQIWLQPSDFADSDVIYNLVLDARRESIYVTGVRHYADPMKGPLYISKLDTSGQVQWIKTINSKGGCCSGHIAINSEGDIMLTASAIDSAIVDGKAYPEGIYLMKLDSDGNVLWNRTTMDNTAAFKVTPANLATGPGGCTYVVGDIENDTIHLDSIHSISAGMSQRIFLIKYDRDGGLVWVRQSDNTDDARATSIGLDAEGNVHAAGLFKNELGFGSIVMQSLDNPELFVVKFDPDGNPLMALRAGEGGSADVTDINVTSDGSIYVTGGAGTNTRFGAHVLKEGGIFVAKFSADGNCNFVTSAYTVGNQFLPHLGASSVTIGGEGAIYIAGSFTGSCMFEPYLIDEPDKYGIFLARVHEPSTSIISTETAAPGRFGLDANYPNPFNPSTTISFDIPTAEFTILDIYDSFGRLISRLFADWLSAGHHQLDWCADNLPSGMYLCRLQSSGRIDTRKLTLLR